MPKVCMLLWKELMPLVICTEWSIFRNPDFKIMKGLLKNNVIFDGRNLYDVEEMRAEGFHYESIGR